ncbi:Lrp/AsnC family transcriptional regulator [Aestuariispira insulae]|uniref:AsnC family transcriptional regulator n=1 Tax=Aestuariispira insulae TaxID=1461337 RepID=A0A3D9HXV8_9PROT|nr:Lrp/AsnC family transcriptional regulator [Aestuariispira insulae]RED54338.1 AsnC family transcriptional regulator [Aestuariispira insulae]
MRPLDDFDRKILSALVEDASQSYAQMGEQVGLSAPAVHERVKRMKKDGVILGTTVRLSGDAVEKPLLSFVQVSTRGWGKSQRLMALTRFPEVEEIHAVAGSTCLLMKVRTRDSQALESLLGQLYMTPQVVSTSTFVVLSTYLERPNQAGVTESWPEIVFPDV